MTLDALKSVSVWKKLFFVCVASVSISIWAITEHLMMDPTTSMLEPLHKLEAEYVASSGALTSATEALENMRFIASDAHPYITEIEGMEFQLRRVRLKHDVVAMKRNLRQAHVGDLTEQFPERSPNTMFFESVLWDRDGLHKFPRFGRYPKAFAEIPGRWEAEAEALWEAMEPYRAEGAAFDYGWKKNEMYGKEVSSLLYGMIRYFKSQVVIEIGSGHSTFVAHQALVHNQQNDSVDYTHVAVEPYRSSVIDALDGEVVVVRAVVQAVEPEFFAQNLFRNDVLFIDSSHVVRQFGDVLFEYMHVLPLLRPGVIVHIHDQCGDYKEAKPCTSFLRDRGWTETEFLLAFLYKNDDWKTLVMKYGSWWLQKVK